MEAEIEVCRLRVRIERLRLAVARSDKEKGAAMREVKGMAAVMRDSIRKLREDYAKAGEELTNEVSAARGNHGKVTSLTKELRAANREVELELGESGSNFHDGEEKSEGQGSSSTVTVPAKPLSTNGVTVNEHEKRTDVDANGVTKAS